jgi:hypothetical protein
MKVIFNLIRIVFAILISVFPSSTVLGTPQIPDNIIYKGEKYQLFNNFPMESYFKKYPEKHPKKDFWVSTALTRGYLATFEIRGNQLYLKDIELRDGDTLNKKGYYDLKWKSVMNEVFPNQKLVKINWVTGLLVLPVGETKYVGYFDPPISDNYIILEMKNGVLKREQEFSFEEFEEFKEKQFEAFKETEEYEKLKAGLLKKRWKEEEIDRHIERQIIEYSTKILVE